MAITVQYAPAAALVAQAAQVAGEGDYNRWAAQQQMQRDQMQQQKDLAQLQVANDQYMQKVGILDQQFRQREQITASQTEQLRNIAAQQGMAQFDAANTNWRFQTGVANDQYMQTQRIQADLQGQQNSILDQQFRQDQTLRNQNLMQMRELQAQNERLNTSLQMDRMNTLTQIAAQQQARREQFQQQQQMAMLDGAQRAGLMGLQGTLNARQTAIEQTFKIQAMNAATKDQLDLSSTLADQKFRQQYFLGEYGSAYETMNERQFQAATDQFNQKRKAMNSWLKENGFAEGSIEYQMAQQRLMEEQAGIKAMAPMYTQAQQDFLASTVKDKGVTYVRNPNGGYDLLPDPKAREKEVAMRGMNDIAARNVEFAMRSYNDAFTAYRERQLALYTGTDAKGNPISIEKYTQAVEAEARAEARRAYKEWMTDASDAYRSFSGESTPAATPSWVK